MVALMISIRKHTAITVLIVFAVMLFSELSPAHEDIQSHKSTQLVQTTLDSAGCTSHPGSQPPADPCQSGICHFGHCAHLEAQNPLAFVPFSTSSIWKMSYQTTIPSPVLDSWKRPPRLS